MSEYTRDVFVLSGGASRGAVQVGMMQTLLGAGVTPDALVGASVGALNAAFLASAPTVQRAYQLADRWLALRTRDIFPGSAWTRLGHLAQRHPYLYSSDGLRTLIDTWAPVRRLEELPTPLRVTTTPLTGGPAAYHDRGDIATLLLASTAVPGVFAPVPLPGLDGHPVPHVDGGVTDLVPLAGAASLEPTRVFVLDATVPTRLPAGRTPLEVLVASLGVAMRARPLTDLGPDVEVHHLYTADLGTRMTDFSRTAELLQLGRRAAAAALDRMYEASPAA
ncbi:MAG: patatin-like phospholipase family protein [Nocardioidaceae bacterium]|nr:patatin-like phospholipase family protein [Nocardioidaceae bacterium]